MNWHSDLFRRLTAMLLVMGVGGVVALVCVRGDYALWVQSLGAASWALSFATAVRVLLAMVLAVSFVASTRVLLPESLDGLAFWLGKALAFFPVTCLAWSFLAWWIGQLGYPIWTLIPVTEPEASLTQMEVWARWSWSWIHGVGIIVLPLTGQGLSLSLESDARSRDVGIDLFGLFALILAICVEDIFAIKGVGTHLAMALRQSDAQNLASAIWMLTAVGVSLAGILSMSERWMPEFADAGRWVKMIGGTLLKMGAWGLSGYILLQAMSMDPRSGGVSAEWLTAFDDPLSILRVGFSWMLGALSLWALGRFIQSR
jgi:hypothetical protein